jgi:hypothetical protein
MGVCKVAIAGKRPLAANIRVHTRQDHPRNGHEHDHCVKGLLESHLLLHCERSLLSKEIESEIEHALKRKNDCAVYKATPVPRIRPNIVLTPCSFAFNWKSPRRDDRAEYRAISARIASTREYRFETESGF